VLVVLADTQWQTVPRVRHPVSKAKLS